MSLIKLNVCVFVSRWYEILTNFNFTCDNENRCATCQCIYTLITQYLVTEHLDWATLTLNQASTSHTVAQKDTTQPLQDTFCRYTDWRCCLAYYLPRLSPLLPTLLLLLHPLHLLQSPSFRLPKQRCAWLCLVIAWRILIPILMAISHKRHIYLRNQLSRDGIHVCMRERHLRPGLQVPPWRFLPWLPLWRCRSYSRYLSRL